MSNPYIPSQKFFDEYRDVAEHYNYRKTKPWPADCLIWRILDPAEEFPRRRWADHQVVEVSSNPYRPPAYVCHPYHLDTDALRDLLALEYAGLAVHIDGYSQYHPTAIRVVIQPTMKHFTAAHGPFDHFDADGNPVMDIIL